MVKETFRLLETTVAIRGYITSTPIPVAKDVYTADQLMYALHTLLEEQLSIAVCSLPESPEITSLFCGNASMLVLLM